MSNKKEIIRIGIIGTGVGLRTHLPAFNRLQNVEVSAISGSSEYRAKEVSLEYNISNPMLDFRSLIDLPNLDLVCITSPNSFHFEQVSYAIEKKVNILCEKPLAISMSEIVQLIDLSKTTNKLTLINHQLRFNPYIRKVRDIIKSNLIGRPYFVKIHQQSTGFANRDTDWSWSFDEKAGGGVRFAMASHLVDLISFWFGNEFLTVRGAMDVVVPKRKTKNGKFKNISVSSFFSSSIAMKNNLDIQLSATAASCGISTFDFSIYGTHGELHFDLDSKLNAAFLKDFGKIKKIQVENVTNEELENKVSIFKGSFIYFAKSIVDAISKKDDSFIEGAAFFENAYNIQVVLDAIQTSALSGDVVVIKDGYMPGASY